MYALRKRREQRRLDATVREGSEMNPRSLSGKKVAILIENGFEEVEMTEPRAALQDAGAEALIVSPQQEKVRAWAFTDWSNEYPVDRQLDQADPEEFDALLLPGGVINPDRLRMQPKAVAFAKSFFDACKPIAAICHGPWMIIEAGAARGKRLASWPSLKTDVVDAGAEWVDEEVVVDGRLVTSRKPDDIPAFNREMIRLFSETSASNAGATAAYAVARV
jgi:protease I